MVRELIECLGKNVKSILLRGSWAWGSPRPDSDIDIGILVKKLDELSMLTLQEFSQKYPRIQIVALTLYEFHYLPLKVYYDFSVRGKVVYGEWPRRRFTQEEILSVLIDFLDEARFTARYLYLYRRPEPGTVLKRARYLINLCVCILCTKIHFETGQYPKNFDTLKSCLRTYLERRIINLHESYPDLDALTQNSGDKIWLIIHDFCKEVYMGLEGTGERDGHFANTQDVI